LRAAIVVALIEAEEVGLGELNNILNPYWSWWWNV